MSLILPALIVLSAFLFGIFLLISQKSLYSSKNKCTLQQLEHLSFTHPPILITTIKDGHLKETRCYLTGSEENHIPEVVEVIPDWDLRLRCSWFERSLELQENAPVPLNT